MATRVPFWRQVGDAIVRRYADSYWALLGLLGLALVPLALMYLVRGVQMVRYGIAGVVGAIGAALLFAHPLLALFLSVFVAFSRLDFVLPGPVSRALLTLAVARLLFDSLSGKPLEWGSRDHRIALTLLLGMMLTSLLFAYDMSNAFTPLTHVAVGLLLYIAVSGLCAHPKRVQQLMLVFSAAFAFEVARYVMKLVSAVGSGVLLQPTGKRLAQGEVNVTATLACCLLVPLVQIMQRSSLRMRLVLSPLVVINIVAVVLSTSRIGFILLGLAAIYLVLRSRHRLLLFALIGTSALVFYFSIPERYWTRFVSLGQLTDIVVDRSLLMRMHVQEVGWRIFMEHFWTGVGIGNFGAWSQRYMSIDLWAHNSLLDVAATLGIFGLAAYLFWLGSAFGMLRSTIQRAGERRLALARAVSFDMAGALGLFLVAALTLDLAYNQVLWLFLGCINALRIYVLSVTEKNRRPGGAPREEVTR